MIKSDATFGLSDHWQALLDSGDDSQDVDVDDLAVCVHGNPLGITYGRLEYDPFLSQHQQDLIECQTGYIQYVLSKGPPGPKNSCHARLYPRSAQNNGTDT